MSENYLQDCPETIKKIYDMEPRSYGFSVFEAWFQCFRKWHYQYSWLLKTVDYAVENSLPKGMPFDEIDGSTVLSLYVAAFDKFKRLLDEGEVEMWERIFGLSDRILAFPIPGKSATESGWSQPQLEAETRLRWVEQDMSFLGDKIAQLNEEVEEPWKRMRAEILTAINQIRTCIGTYDPTKDAAEEDKDISPMEESLGDLERDVGFIRCQVKDTTDSRAMELVAKLELDVFSTTNQLRGHFGIPYKDEPATSNAAESVTENHPQSLPAA